MKKLFLLLLLSASTRMCYAQLNVGLKFSNTVNKFVLKTSNDDEYLNNDVLSLAHLGLNAGIVGNYKFSRQFSIQSELIFDAFKTNFAKIEFYTNWQGERTAIGNGFNVNMNYLEMPCIGKLSFGNKVTFDVLAGAYLGYLLSAKQSTDNGKLNMPADTIYQAFYGPEPKTIDYSTHNVRSDYTSFNAGVLVGMGVTIHDKVTLELRLNRGLVNINKIGSAKMNTLQAQLSVGWYMFKYKKKV